MSRCSWKILLGSFAWVSVLSCSKAHDSIEFKKVSADILCRVDHPWSEPYEAYGGWSVRNGKRNPFQNVFQWRGPDGRVITFEGMVNYGGAGWWFGKLDGKPAAGYNLNRQHHVFSTADTHFDFDCWAKGWNEHTDE